MTLMKKEIEWDFSATSHGKGDSDGFRRYMKTIHKRKNKSTCY